MSISETAAWQVSTGTARGAAHETRHQPNQDNVGFQAAGPAGGVVVAVADGHGAGRHFRSLTGSLLAVRAGCGVVAELAGDAPGDPGAGWTAERAGALREQLAEAIVARWRELVARHRAGHPYTPGEQAALDAAGDGPDIPYGSTLLVALVAGGWLVCGQIGDGDMLAVRPDGGAWSPVGGDDRLDGYHTTSLCQRGAVASFRTAAHDLRTEPLLALLLGTDGYGNAQADDEWQPGVARDLAGFAARHDQAWFAEQVPLWAGHCASAAGSGDDTTIALLLAPDSARLAARGEPAIGDTRSAPAGSAATVARGQPAAVQAMSPPAVPAAAAARGQRATGGRPAARRRILIAVAAVVVAAAAVIAGVLAMRPGPAPGPVPTGQPAPRAPSVTATPAGATRAGTSTTGGPARQASPVTASPGGPAPVSRPAHSAGPARVTTGADTHASPGHAAGPEG